MPGRAWLREARRTSNPLLRRPTRQERVAVLAAVVLAAVFASLAGLAVASVYAQGVHDEVAQRLDRQPVTATVETAPDPAGVLLQSSAYGVVTYSWKDRPHREVARMDLSQVAGSQVTVWLGGSGLPVDPPRSRDETTADTVGAGTLALTLLVILIAAEVHGVREWRLRSRSRQWEVEWEHLRGRLSGTGNDR
jgi:hypothetical protein